MSQPSNGPESWVRGRHPPLVAGRRLSARQHCARFFAASARQFRVHSDCWFTSTTSQPQTNWRLPAPPMTSNTSTENSHRTYFKQRAALSCFVGLRKFRPVALSSLCYVCDGADEHCGLTCRAAGACEPLVHRARITRRRDPALSGSVRKKRLRNESRGGTTNRTMTTISTRQSQPWLFVSNTLLSPILRATRSLGLGAMAQALALRS